MKPVVFLVWTPWLGLFHERLLLRLQQDYRFRVYAKDEADAEAVRRRFLGAEAPEVVPFHSLYAVANEPVRNPSKVINTAMLHERWLGTTFSRLSVADRHLGRSFALGGARFPRSPQSKATRLQVLNAFSTAVDFWRREFESHKPVLVIGSENVLSAVARRLDVSIREATTSRHGSFFYWGESSRLESSNLHRLWSKIIADNKENGLTEPIPGNMTTKYLKARQGEATYFNAIKKAGLAIASRGKAVLRCRDLSTSYYLHSTIAYIFRRRRQLANLSRPGLATLDSLKGDRFVFFPLATEPETTLQVLSPEYFFQLETIAALARDLPSDVSLVVKEHHPACGARADLFYEQICEFKAVKMADIRERGIDLIREAEVTVTISGSGGFEAATMGKPTIVLGRNNIYSFLPHVSVVTDIAEMRAALQDALEGRLAGPKAKEHGAALLRAIEMISWNMAEFDPYSQRSDVSDAVVNVAIEKLFATHPRPEANAAVLQDRSESTQ